MASQASRCSSESHGANDRLERVVSNAKLARGSRLETRDAPMVHAGLAMGINSLLELGRIPDGAAAASRHVAPELAPVPPGGLRLGPAVPGSCARCSISCDPRVTPKAMSESRARSFYCLTRENWSRRSGSNGRPADYESAALPTELRRL